MTQIRDYAIERLASTIYDDDLIDIQIMEAGADQYKEARMKVSELRKLMNDGVTPKRYKALISQNAPVSTTQTPSIIAGQIWEDTIGTANAGDLVILGGYELISGTLGAVNAKYRSATDDTPNFTTASLEYDGSPYIVSTDVNGNFAPFVNTTGETPTYSYVVPGRFSLTSPNNLYLLGKTTSTIGQRSDDTWKNAIDTPTTSLADINTFINGTRSDGMLYYSLIEIEVYP